MVYQWLLRQLKQPSTWRGIVIVLTACGVVFTPEQVEAIVLAGSAIIAAIDIIKNDDKVKLPPIELQSNSEDDGYINRDTLRRGLRVNLPPDHITGTLHDERQPTGFENK